ncbi:MAG: hypothetical protein AB4050_03020 [Synechococcus sp.]
MAIRCSVDVDAGVMKPAADSSLFALGELTSAGTVRQPAGEVAFTCLDEGHYHPQASGQMSLMDPRAGLPQPALQRIVEGGVFCGIFVLSVFLSRVLAPHLFVNS